MAAWVQQAAVVVLAVQFYQDIAQVAQNFSRNPAVIHKSLPPAIGGDGPAQDQIAGFRRKARRLKHRQGGMAGGQIETRRHLALIGALPHQISPALPAQHEAERIQQDRLAGPGLAGQDVQARRHRQFQPVDDQQIADFKAEQHGNLG